MISGNRLGIYQLATPNIDVYAKYSIASVWQFASKFGYDFYVQREPLINDMHINWSKISLLQHASRSSNQYSLLLDADTVLVNTNFDLDQWFAKMEGGISILMTKDTPLFKRNRPNAGMILLENERGESIIDYWMEAARNEGSHLADIHPRNQRVYWNFVQPKYGSSQLMVSNSYAAKYHWFVPYLPFSDKFLFHFTQSDSSLRAKYMKLMFDRYVGDDELLERTSKLLDENERGQIQIN